MIRSPQEIRAESRETGFPEIGQQWIWKTGTVWHHLETTGEQGGYCSTMSIHIICYKPLYDSFGLKTVSGACDHFYLFQPGQTCFFMISEHLFVGANQGASLVIVRHWTPSPVELTCTKSECAGESALWGSPLTSETIWWIDFFLPFLMNCCKKQSFIRFPRKLSCLSLISKFWPG